MSFVQFTRFLLLRLLTAVDEWDNQSPPEVPTHDPETYNKVVLGAWGGVEFDVEVSGPDNAPIFTTRLDCGHSFSLPSKKCVLRMAAQHECSDHVADRPLSRS